jgi:hypothetical protein
MKVTLANRLPYLLIDRGISSASEFGRRMTESGYKMSSAQASRYMKSDMPLMSLDFLSAACEVLGCYPSDLFKITVSDVQEGDFLPNVVAPQHASIASDRALEVSPDVSAGKSQDEEDLSAILGPRARSFPKVVK